MAVVVVGAPLAMSRSVTYCHILALVLLVTQGPKLPNKTDLFERTSCESSSFWSSFSMAAA